MSLCSQFVPDSCPMDDDDDNYDYNGIPINQTKAEVKEDEPATQQNEETVTQQITEEECPGTPGKEEQTEDHIPTTPNSVPRKKKVPRVLFSEDEEETAEKTESNSDSDPGCGSDHKIRHKKPKRSYPWFFAKELTKHQEFADIFFREQKTLVETDSLIEEDIIRNKKHPFFERLQRLFYWDTKPNRYQKIGSEFPERIEKAQVKDLLKERRKELVMMPFETDILFTKQRIPKKSPLLDVHATATICDLEVAKDFYYVHSKFKENNTPPIEHIRFGRCFLSMCIFTATSFRYGRMPVMGMIPTKTEMDVEAEVTAIKCLLCAAKAHTLCLYYSFCEKLVQFWMARNEKYDRFTPRPDITSILLQFYYCQNCGRQYNETKKSTIRGVFMTLCILGLVPDFEVELEYNQAVQMEDEQECVDSQNLPISRRPFTFPISNNRIRKEIFRVMNEGIIYEILLPSLESIHEERGERRLTYSEFLVQLILKCGKYSTEAAVNRVFRDTFIDYESDYQGNSGYSEKFLT